jgi:TetR/AcrR family transcriptional regulator, transcriptional repressor for nem operon
MRYVKGHRLQTRSRIVEHASYGLRQRGADGLSVVDLMKLVGLTHGGFYSHFASRDRTIAHWLKLMQEMPVEQRFDVIVDAYLSPAHRDDRARGCVLRSLRTNIARSSPTARHIFARKLGEMIDMLAALSASVLVTMMGAIVLARDRRRTTVRRHSCIRTADTRPSIHRRIGRRTDQHM